ncbi:MULTISPECIES: type I secretion system permease/ATPase [Vibrio]|mgnify:FL=1|uniref:Type I secretion system permease/ATPase n=1 Tax=Vibrio cyclitrophicus ZF270 TaxID=1136176 RepID=A0AAN0LU25_9VIBR|nr:MULTISPECIES: type I secretion system permease/ATPase [Vibrio]KNH11445.1 ABC transporter [Vibrio lentus]MBY7659373.1 type I secretion system permease/ATPase [Vibrio atlanticus]ERM58392.1 ABC transporter, transmembrane region:ABC transporter:Peptidase C39, bacteriocin processing [Vibrio cyclitrophicus FF75]KAA8602808.1 ABC transporter transmembrane region:ABC transporter:Peptidase C39 bacteriocin processing [Vibrio cyclitrophicus]MBE8558325.1 type I secretion system permease/ATPase [Vibrio s|tara:strand:- start:4834 stop:6948 length:2115 start_codon:yes stop_codon:yes gene_type:complete
MQDPLLNSLIYVSRYYGLANSPEALINGLPLSDGKLTPFLFPRSAERAGLVAKENRCDLESIPHLILPAILLLKQGEACVLNSIDSEKQEAEIITAESGMVPIIIPLDELKEQFIGRYFLVKKQFRYDERSPEVLKTRKGHWFWSTIWESKNIYRDVLIASILINIFAIAAPMFTRLVYDKVVPNLAFETLWVLASGIFVVFLFDLLLKLMRSYFIDVAGKKSDILISSKLFSKVLGIRMEAKPASVGAFAKNLQEFESIREFFTSATIGSLIDLPFALMFLALIWLMAGNLVFVPVAGVVVLIIYALLIQGPLRRTIEEGSRLASQKYANLIESLAGLETVKLFSAQSQFQFRWEEAVAHMANWNIKSRRITDSIQNTAGFVQQSTNVGMIIFGVYLIAEGELTMGGLIAATMLSGRAIGPLVQLSLLSTRYNQAKSSMTLIEQVMSMPDEQEEGKRYIHRPIIQGHIALDKVTFHYPDSPVASIRDLTLNISPGEKVAIIGRIGSGKTTLERLIMGLYKPTEGHVRIDDTDMEQLHHVDVRRNIGCVPQDSNLFYGSVRDNITLGRPLVDDRDVMDAANRAGVTAFTQQDPAGLERQVGEGGALLSGGQRQSIAIARAFLGRPPVLLLDEPTSAMDNRSEMHIKHQLSQLQPSETLILITHKTSMLDIVDRVIVMEKGSIIADGPKAQVLSDLKQGKVRAAS